jgi:hypothetical protein
VNVVVSGARKVYSVVCRVQKMEKKAEMDVDEIRRHVTCVAR